MLALYSDGVTESTSPGGEEFGEDGLAKFLLQRRSESCAHLVAGLIDFLRDWHGSSSFTDDFTIVLVKRAEHQLEPAQFSI
jgi:sigma-B regulation protein RsbU (phosphoserine phosphatase)